MFNQVRNMSQITICGDYGETNVINLVHQSLTDTKIDGIHFSDVDEYQKQIDCLIFRGIDVNFNDPVSLKKMISILSSVQGILIYNGDLNNRFKTNGEIKRKIHINKVSYGMNEKCDIYITNVLTSFSKTSFDLYLFHELVGHISVPIVGKEHLYDLLAYIALMNELGYFIDEILQQINDISTDLVYLEHGYERLIQGNEIKEIQSGLEELYLLDPYSPIYIVNEKSIDLQKLNMAPISTVVYALDLDTWKSKCKSLKGNEKYAVMILK